MVQAEETFEKSLGETKVGDVTATDPVQVPFITWGGDVATFVANGGLTTQKDSIYGKAGLNLKLVPGDDFQQQVKDYISGKSPYLRGTVHMLGMASEAISRDPKTKPVMIMQMTWSAGDHIVSRSGTKNLNDLKGKKVALQAGGPHLGLLDDSLKAAGLKWTDIKVVYVKDLTGPNGPAELFKKDETVDACCVITPDMIGLCSGIDQVGSGAEGTVKGAHVLNSTASMSRSIADVYVVRSDYYKAHKDEVEKFVVGYLKATEDLLKWKKDYNDGIMRKLFDSGWHPGFGQESVRQEKTLLSLTPEEWDKLKPVGTLQVPRLVFARGTAKLTEASEATLRELSNKLKAFPQYYLIVRGNAASTGDLEANLKLAKDRADATVLWLTENGVDKNRIRSESAKPNGSTTVAFLLGELPY